MGTNGWQDDYVDFTAAAENAFESDSGQDSVWQVAHDSGWLTSKNSKSTVERYRFRTLKRLSEPKHCANDENA